MTVTSGTLVKKDPWHRNHLIRDAIGRALYEGMRADSSIHLFGEGAHMKVHFDSPLIEKEFSSRVHTLPISEDGNVNFAVGAALMGVKPVVDIITADFLYRAADSICNTAAKLNFLLARDDTPKTIVIRAEFLLAGPTTGQRPEALFTHIPGLNVVLPSTPRDAYGLMTAALSMPGVTLFFEDRMIADSEIKSEDYDDPALNPECVLGTASIQSAPGRREKLTVITYGVMCQLTKLALDYLHQTNILTGTDRDAVTIIDLRTLFPIDWDTLMAAIKRTMNVLIIEPDIIYGGIGAEILATFAEMPLDEGFYAMRIGAIRQTVPASISAVSEFGLTRDMIALTIKERIARG